MLELRVKEARLTCVTAGVAKFSSAFIDEAVSQHLKVSKDTKPREIMDIMKVHFSEGISYKVAQMARNRLVDGGLGAHRYSF